MAQLQSSSAGGPIKPACGAGRVFCVITLLGLLTASARAELSEKTRIEITAMFPRFSPPSSAKPVATGNANVPTPLSDDPLDLLPDYHVREKRLPQKDSDVWLTRRAMKDKAMLEYYESMTNLEWALNSWYIPLPFGYSLTPAVQARANTAHVEKMLRRDYKQLSSLVSAVAAVDSVEAKKLLHDLDLTGHPAN